jgi:hypothetical protein
MEDSSNKRSRSPRRDRSKDRGPPRERKQGGFRWKDKSSRADQDDRDDRRLQRGYRDRSRSPRRNRDRRDDRNRDEPSEKKRRERSPAREDGEVTEEPSRSERRRSPARGDSAKAAKDGDAPAKKEKKKSTKPVAPAPVAGQEMIIVHVNDRMGTKAAIPCFASDPISAFKIMVGARIGRNPNHILLKRQSERPFKDQLTLADYGVSNGVQLDLEIDTSG